MTFSAQSSPVSLRAMANNFGKASRALHNLALGPTSTPATSPCFSPSSHTGFVPFLKPTQLPESPVTLREPMGPGDRQGRGLGRWGTAPRSCYSLSPHCFETLYRQMLSRSLGPVSASRPSTKYTLF